MISYIKGFYESEGHCRNRGIVICNTNTDYINLMTCFMDYFKFKTHLYVYENKKGYKTSYHLCITSKKERNRFFNLIKPCIKIAPMITCKHCKIKFYYSGSDCCSVKCKNKNKNKKK